MMRMSEAEFIQKDDDDDDDNNDSNNNGDKKPKIHREQALNYS